MKSLFPVLAVLVLLAGCETLTPEDRVARFGPLVKQNPGDAHAQFQLGKGLFGLERYAEAEIHLEEALRLDPELSEARLLLGTLYTSRKDFDRALDVLNPVKSSPDAETAFVLGSAHIGAGNYDAGTEYLAIAIHARPELLGVYHNAVKRAEAQGGKNRLPAGTAEGIDSRLHSALMERAMENTLGNIMQSLKGEIREDITEQIQEDIVLGIR